MDYHPCSPILVSGVGHSQLLSGMSVASLTLSLPSVWTPAPAPSLPANPAAGLVFATSVFTFRRSYYF